MTPDAKHDPATAQHRDATAAPVVFIYPGATTGTPPARPRTDTTPGPRPAQPTGRINMRYTPDEYERAGAKPKPHQN